MSRRILLCLIVFVAAMHAASAQMWSVGTNLVGYADLGTLNIEASHAVSQHFTTNIGVRFNPWTFNADNPDKQFQNRKQSYALGVRWWPWYCYSGWWVALAGQYQEYNRGGLFSKETEEGDAFGGSLGFGFTWMIHQRWNVELGASGWAGKTTYQKYACPYCGKLIDSGSRFFVLPNDVFVTIAFIF